MAIRQYPFDEMERMFDQMRRSMMGVDHEAEGHAGANLSIETDDEGYVVYADVPGFEKSEIDLQFDGEVLRIEAEHVTEAESSTRSRQVTEQVHVPGEIVAEEITASYHNGVLEVHLPTVDERDASTRIEIE